MSSQKKIPVDQETGTRDPISGGRDSGYGGTFAGENGIFHSLGFGDSFAETPWLS